MKVPSKDYSRQHRQIWEELLPALEGVFFDDQPVLGQAVSRFEAALAEAHQVEHAVGVGSGTDAITLMLHGLGIGEGDEVVTGAHTFTGVLSAILRAGAQPVLVDAEPETCLMDIDRIAQAITERTKAILAVHLYGHPLDLDRLNEIARDYDVLLLEDAAQAHGASWGGRPVGSFGRAAALSFHPSKNLGAVGDGGAVLTGDEALAEWLKVARNLGKDGKYAFALISGNTKLDSIQAAILEVKLRHLAEWVQRRRAHAAIYREELAGVGDLRLPPEADDRASPAYHLFVVRTDKRYELREFLKEKGVRASLHYPIAAHHQTALAPVFSDAGFPVAEELARTVLSLPVSQELTEDEVRYVARQVRAFFEE